MHGDSLEKATGRRRVMLVAGHIGLGMILMLGLALAFGYIVMLLWNAIMPDVLGTRQVSYWQAVGLLILARLLVGGFHHGSHGRRRRRRREAPALDIRHDTTLDEFVDRGRPPREGKMTSRYLEAFRMMWDAFPEPAMLIDGQHKVVAINAVGRLVGIVPGMKCEGLNPMRRPESAFAPPEEALRTRETVVGVSETNGRPVLAYWVPVAGTSDLFVHFGIGVLDAAVAPVWKRTLPHNRQ